MLSGHIITITRGTVRVTWNLERIDLYCSILLQVTFGTILFVTVPIICPVDVRNAIYEVKLGFCDLPEYQNVIFDIVEFKSSYIILNCL